MKRNFNKLVADFGFEQRMSESAPSLYELRELGYSGVYPQDLFCSGDRNGSEDLLFSAAEETQWGRSESSVREFCESVRRYGLSMESAHFVQTLPPPGEPVEWIYERHEKLVKRAAWAGLQRFTTHIGWMYGLASEQYMGSSAVDYFLKKRTLRELHQDGRKRYGGLDRMVGDSIKVYQHLCDESAKHGIVVTVESACVEALEINTTADALIAFQKEVNRENLKFCLDPGHCQWNGVDPVELTYGLGNQIVEVHFHDNFGDADSHMPVGEGSIRWDELARALSEVGYEGEITFEQRDYRANQQYWERLVHELSRNNV